MNHRLPRLAIFLFLLISIPAFASPKWFIDLNKGSGQVDFHAIGNPSAIKIHGKGESPKGGLTLENGVMKGIVMFALNSLDTGMKLRNEHMKTKYLETQKYPDAKLEITSLKFAPPAGDFSEVPVPFQGNLTLHGVTQPITGTAKAEKKGGKINTTANFETKISAYKIPVPSFSGITVADRVQVEVSFSAPVIIK